MKKITAFLTAIFALCGVSCAEKNPDKPTENSSQVINGEQVEIVDNSKLYKKSELPSPVDIQGISSICYSENSGNIHIIGNDADGNIRACVTDSGFSMYSYADLRLKIDYSKEYAAFTACDDKIYAMISTEIPEADTGEIGYKYTLIAFDNSGIQLSKADFTIDDQLLSDSLFKGVSSMRYIGENRLIIAIDSHFLLIDTEGNVIEALDQASADEKTPPQMGYIRYFTDNSNFYGIATDKTTVKLIDYTASGLSGISAISPIANGDFLCVTGGRLHILSERDIAEYSQMQTITLAAASKIDEIQPAIAEFNASSNLYQIDLKNYLVGYEYSVGGIESAVNDLEMDIISGKIPDMVYLDTLEIDTLSSKGAFADLYGFMANDSQFSRDAFLPNYLAATETDGKLFSIAPTFTISTIAAKSRHTDIENWTFEEFKEVYEANSPEMTLFESANNRNAVFGFLSNDCKDFVDYATHTCSFDSEDFINLLEYSGEFPSIEEYSWETTSCKKDTALISNLHITSFRDINVRKQAIFGDDITFAGYPSDDGNGSSICLSQQFAIMEDSPAKEGAWSFIRTFFNSENYRGNTDGIPVTEKGLEIAMAEAIEPLYYIDRESGKKVPMPESGFNFNTNENTEITPMTKAEQESYEAFIRSITTAASGTYDEKINGIVNEEISRYFAGACTAEECAEIIQNRVSIMLSEQS